MGGWRTDHTGLPMVLWCWFWHWLLLLGWRLGQQVGGRLLVGASIPGVPGEMARVPAHVCNQLGESAVSRMPLKVFLLIAKASSPLRVRVLRVQCSV